MANTLVNYGIGGLLQAWVWEVTVTSDASGNISEDISWSDLKNTPTQWSVILAQGFDTNPSTPSNYFGDVTFTPDYTNRVIKVRGRNFPASTANIKFWVIAM